MAVCFMLAIVANTVESVNALLDRRENVIRLANTEQVFRFVDNECAVRDVIGRADESFSGAQPLLQQVMREGKRCSPVPTLDEIKQHCAQSLKQIPLRFRELTQAEQYPVSFSDQLKRLLEDVKHELDGTVASEEGR